MRIRYFIVHFAIVAIAVGSIGADWQQFRGSDGNGVAPTTALPDDWESSLAWKIDLPGRGPSSPIVVGDRVVVTGSSGVKQDRLHVICFDAESGKKIWHRQFWATGRTFCHPSSSIAAPTPASDGKHILAFYSSNDLICLDLDGNLCWYRGIVLERPRVGNDIGMSSSPLVVGDVVVVQMECQGDPVAMAVDIATGKTRWTQERKPMANWSSPVLYPGENGGSDLVLLQSPWGITAHDPATGQKVWEHKVECATISSAAVADGKVFLPAGGITALDARTATADGVQVAWTENRLQPSGASPTVYNGRVYAINRSGVLSCGDLATEKIAWQLRLDGHHYCTPILAGDKILAVSDKGKIQVVQLGEEGKLVSSYELDDRIQTTPAVTDNGVYIRSDAHLWKFTNR